ncbi:MAG: carbohydrate kinase family protein [Nitrososphaeria archaeon]
MSQRYDLLILSDCVLDVYYRIESLPVKPEQASESEEPYFYPGGACNVAIVARKLGLRVSVVDRLGNDCLSKILVNELERNGIDLKIVFDSTHLTSLSNNIFDSKGRHAFIGYSGAGAYLDESEIDEEALLSSRAVFFDGYTLNDKYPSYRAIKRALKIAKDASKTIFFDPGPRRVKGIEEFIEYSSVVFFNRDEMQAHVGRGFRESLEELKRDEKRVYVVKLGANGSLCVYGGRVTRIRAVKPRKMIHTIGAGDAFDATFIAFYLRGYSPEVACMYSSVMASLKLETMHAGELPGLKDFLKISEGHGLNFYDTSP